MTEFERWVADTVQAVSGIRPQYPCDPQRERVLTCVNTGVVACQEVAPRYFGDSNQATTRAIAIAGTNLLQFAPKPHGDSQMSAVPSSIAQPLNVPSALRGASQEIHGEP